MRPPSAGRHDLVADFPDALVTVPMGTESPAALDLLDKNNVKIGTLTGSLYNLRSYVLPVDQCEFDWLAGRREPAVSSIEDMPSGDMLD